MVEMHLYHYCTLLPFRSQRMPNITLRHTFLKIA